MVQVGASELVISVAAEDVSISEVEARSEVPNILRRLTSDHSQHADTGSLEEGGGGVNKLADIVEHICQEKTSKISLAPFHLRKCRRWKVKAINHDEALLCTG